MKFKGTVLMAAAFLSLVGYYFFIDLPAEQKQKDQEAFDEKVLPLKLKQVTEVSIIQADTTITVKRSTANNWDLTYPISAPGDTAEIESFISGVGSLLKTRVVEKAPEDLSIYGLNTPSLKIYFKTQRSQEETLLVGDESPLGGSLYLK